MKKSYTLISEETKTFTPNGQVGTNESNGNNQYGTVPFEIEDPEDNVDRFAHSEYEEADWRSPSQRWSVLDKLAQRYYCRIRSCSDCLSILSCRCLFSTAMLGIFVILAAVFLKSVVYTADGSNSSGLIPILDFGYDFIIVGAGPAGSVITSHLITGGAKVLLLEAGTNTQYDLGGSDYFGGPITKFDIPLLWPSISHFDDFYWHGFNLPNVLIAKGLGGCGIHNAMLYALYFT
jgi:hypothetical protein